MFAIKKETGKVMEIIYKDNNNASTIDLKTKEAETIELNKLILINN